MIYFNSKAKKSIVHHYAVEYVVNNYNVDKSNLKKELVDFYFGLGFYQVLLIDEVTNQVYLLDVDIRDDYSLIYVRDESEYYIPRTN